MSDGWYASVGWLLGNILHLSSSYIVAKVDTAPLFVRIPFPLMSKLQEMILV
jgi:hypothetical protein